MRSVRMRGWPPVIVGLGLVTVAMSLLAAVAARAGWNSYAALALVPERVWRGELWRMLTWSFVEPGPIGLVIHMVGLSWFGSQLVGAWGSDRFARYVATVIGAATVGTLALSLVSPLARWVPHLGGAPLEEALVIAWALQFPERRLRVYGLLRLGGPPLAYGVAAVVAVIVVYVGVAPVAPLVFATATALSWMTDQPWAWWRARRGPRPWD